MATLKPPAGASGVLVPVLRFARRDDLDGRYGWDWHVPGTDHESPKVYRTRLMAKLAGWRWRRAVARAGRVEIVSLAELLQIGADAETGAGAAAA